MAITAKHIEDLARVAAQFMAVKASSHVAGGGLSGLLLSSVAMKGVDRIFSNPKQKQDAEPGKADDDGPESVGRRIGDAAAGAIERILREKFPGGSSANGPAPNQSGSASAGNGPSLPNPAPNQSARDYVRSLSEEQRDFIRSTGKVSQGAAPAGPSAPGAAANVAPAAATRAAPAAEATGAAGAGRAATAMPAAAPVAAAAAVALVFYEVVKAGKELAYAQEQYSRKLGEYNPTIAAQNIELDVNRILRDMQSGDRLAGSNAELIGSIDRFERAIRPFEDIANRLKNAIGSDVMNGIAQTLESIDKAVGGIYDKIYGQGEWEKFKDGTGSAPAGGFGDFLDAMNEEARKEREEAERKMEKTRRIANEMLGR